MTNGRNLIMALIIAAVIFSMVRNFSTPTPRQQINYSSFVGEVQSDRVASVVIDGVRIVGTRKDGSQFLVIRPNVVDDGLMGDLLNHSVQVEGRQPREHSVWVQLLIGAFPILLIIAAFAFFSRQLQNGVSGRNGPLSFGRNRARLNSSEDVDVTFKDVAGVDEAREDVQELVEFLRAPDKFQRLGGRIPRGVLMVGPPGTGKTLLARAIAGEAGVPFFSISGSDFVEMFVGVGASRVRDMFEQARKVAPCIVFIDEIDAVGRHRGAGLGGGHDEREQTLNQLLVEMDGFDAQDGIIVIAATNRPDVLDPALLRPGRFDRQVVVNLPDIRGRTEVLQVHTRKLALAPNLELSVIARGTPGFSGADLANLVNEAALAAARLGADAIDMSHLEWAKDKIMMGTERRSMVMNEKEKRLTAYHESGHAIVGRLLPDHDPVYKVTIIPHGRALGVTMFLPEEDQYSQNRSALVARITSLFGGRAAEELVFGADAVTTGASNDIRQATELARNMVTKWGLSEKMGPLRYDDDDEDVFLGRRVATGSRNVSSETARELDDETRRIIDECHRRAKTLLEENRDTLERMAEALIEYETLDTEQLDDVMAGRAVRPSSPPPTRGDDESKNASADDESASADGGAADDATDDDAAPDFRGGAVDTP